MSQLTSLGTVAFFFLAGCHFKTQGGSTVQTADPVKTRLNDFVSEDLFDLKRHSPILLLCRIRPDPSTPIDTTRPYDLIIQRRESTTTVNAPYDFYFRVTPPSHQALPPNQKLKIWTVSMSSLFTPEGEEGQFHDLIFTGGTGFRYQVGLPSRLNNTFLLNVGPSGNMRCEESSKLADKSPQPGEDLVISATRGDSFLSLSVTVDALLADEKGSEKIITNSKPHGHAKADASIKGAPVFNKSNELVGFVEEYNPGATLGIKIQSIHDPHYGTALNQVIAQKNWAPKPPQSGDSRISQRFMHLCSQCPNSFFKRICVGVGASRPPT